MRTTYYDEDDILVIHLSDCKCRSKREPRGGLRAS